MQNRVKNKDNCEKMLVFQYFFKKGEYMSDNYIIEMLNITKEFPGIIANDNVTNNLL